MQENTQSKSAPDFLEKPKIQVHVLSRPGESYQYYLCRQSATHAKGPDDTIFYVYLQLPEMEEVGLNLIKAAYSSLDTKKARLRGIMIHFDCSLKAAQEILNILESK